MYTRNEYTRLTYVTARHSLQSRILMVPYYVSSQSLVSWRCLQFHLVHCQLEYHNLPIRVLEDRSKGIDINSHDITDVQRECVY